MPKSKPLSLRIRILEALRIRGGNVPYDQLLRAVFPEERYPNAFRYQSHGGPPGCAMPFRKAMNALVKNEMVHNYWRDRREWFALQEGRTDAGR